MIQNRDKQIRERKNPLNFKKNDSLLKIENYSNQIIKKRFASILLFLFERMSLSSIIFYPFLVIRSQCFLTLPNFCGCILTQHNPPPPEIVL